MKTLPLHGFCLYYDRAEAAAAGLVRQACDRCVPVLTAGWGLPTPADCRVYVMTSWVRFVFHSAPWPRRVAYALCFPIVWLRAARVWPYAGGWNLPHGQRMAVGIKPPRLIDRADRSLGRQVFIPAATPEETVQRIVCHELTHAFSTHLRLPTWLHEGLAMLTVDRALGQPTVQPATLDRLARPDAPVERANLRHPEAMLDLYICGYWLTRYLAEAHPALLRRLLAQTQSRANLEAAVARELGVTGRALWAAAGPLVTAHFAAERHQS
jgi:hypothetical protein